MDAFISHATELKENGSLDVLKNEYETVDFQNGDNESGRPFRKEMDQDNTGSTREIKTLMMNLSGMINEATSPYNSGIMTS
jgi:hypothetical protein